MLSVLGEKSGRGGRGRGRWSCRRTRSFTRKGEPCSVVLGSKPTVGSLNLLFFLLVEPAELDRWKETMMTPNRRSSSPDASPVQSESIVNHIPSRCDQLQLRLAALN